MPIAYPYRFSDWYGYDKDCSTITSFSSSLSGRSADVCFLSINQTYYHNGSGTYPVVNDVCYSNSAGTTFLAQGFRKLGSGVKYRIDSNGVLGQITLC